jgi:hypothetical protein
VHPEERTGLQLRSGQPPYSTRILILTALAPDIVEVIINGEESDGISLARLIHFFPEV